MIDAVDSAPNASDPALPSRRTSRNFRSGDAARRSLATDSHLRENYVEIQKFEMTVVNAITALLLFLRIRFHHDFWENSPSSFSEYKFI